MSLDPISAKIKELTFEAHSINERFVGNSVKKSESEAFLKRIENCFKESVPLVKDWAKGDSKVSAENLSKELQKLEKNCAILKLGKQSESIQKFLEKKDWAKDERRAFLEFVPNDRLLQVAALNSDWQEDSDVEIGLRINQGASVKEFGFDEKSLKMFLERNGEKIRTLNLHEFKITGGSLFDHCTNLIGLDLSSCQFESWMVRAPVLQHKNLKNLEKLDLSMGVYSRTDANLISEFKNLRVLNMAHCHLVGKAMIPIAKGLTLLEELNVSGNYELNGESVEAISEIKSLKVLIAVNIGLAGEGIHFILEKLTGLRKLDISNNSLNDEDLQILAKNLTALEVLGLGAPDIGDSITSKGISWLVEGIPLLQELSVSNNRKLKDEGAKEIANFKNLKILNVNSCKITDVGIGYIARGVPGLQKLYVSGNYNESWEPSIDVYLKKAQLPKNCTVVQGLYKFDSECLTSDSSLRG